MSRRQSRIGPCSAEGCARPIRARGLCTGHYEAAHTQGPCAVAACASAAKKRGMCVAHYERARRHGDPTIRKTPSWSGVVCSRPGCSLRVSAGGLCRKHYFRKWSRDNADSVRAMTRRYTGSAKGRAARHTAESLRRAATERGDADREFAEFLLTEAVRCGLCLLPLGDDRSLDHVHPISRGGVHDMRNLQVLHRACNSIKNDRPIGRVL